MIIKFNEKLKQKGCYDHELYYYLFRYVKNQFLFYKQISYLSKTGAQIINFCFKQNGNLRSDRPMSYIINSRHLYLNVIITQSSSSAMLFI